VTRRTTTAIALAVALGVVAPIPSALAKDGDIIARAGCSDSSNAKLKLSEENGRIEVEFEVDQNRNGVRWSWSLRRPSRGVVRSGTAVTRAPSGSFEVRRVLSDLPGPDRITARATNARGAVCLVRATSNF
jgi:hypothetical protein